MVFRLLLICMVLLLSQNLNSQTPYWDCLPMGKISSYVTHINVYKGKLLITGQFKRIDTIITNGIITWDGNKIETFDKGLKMKSKYSPFVSKTINFNNKLYVVGDFDSAGNVAANDIAVWDGIKWDGIGLGTDGALQSIALYKNEIYVSGFFDSIGGKQCQHIAKWNGSNWEQVGKGIKGYSVNCLYVYKNELYALGAIDSADGKTTNSIARWDGSQWHGVSDMIKDGYTMIEWRGKLLIAAQNRNVNNVITRQIMQWDGTDCSIFSEQKMFTISDITIFNDKLYCAGGYTTFGYNTNVAMYDSVSQTWKKIGKGINDGVTELCVWKNNLYVSGIFNQEDSGICDFIAVLNTNTSAINIVAKEMKRVTVTNNQDEIIVQSNLKNATVNLYKIQGQLIYSKTIIEGVSILKDVNYNGFIIWKVEDIEDKRKNYFGKIMVY